MPSNLLPGRHAQAQLQQHPTAPASWRQDSRRDVESRRSFRTAAQVMPEVQRMGRAADGIRGGLRVNAVLGKGML
ncbi:MAG TPA: hypothetical protein VLM37_02290 [Fibrobacteraceae bacterium]|nr:hypothetical protein [Fibrobacteraceae bacterium]